MATATPIGICAGGSEVSQVHLPIAADLRLLEGTMIARTPQGRACNVGDGLPVIGVARNGFDNRIGSEAGGADAAFEVPIDVGVFWFRFSGTAPLPGQRVFALDNETVTLTAGSNGLAGVCVAGKQVFGVLGHEFVAVLFGPLVIASIPPPEE